METSVRLKDIAIKRRDLFSVSPDVLHIKPDWNSRDALDPANDEHIATLAASIAEIGVQMPLTAYKEGDLYFVADGHCRLMAVRRAIASGHEIKSVPIQVEERGADEGDRIVGQIVRNSGKNLTPLEQASVIKRLLDFGWSEEMIAKKIGKAKAQVIDLLDLRAAPAAVVDMVRSGEVSTTLAIETLKTAKGDVKAATETLKTAVESAKARGKTKATAKDVGTSQSAAFSLLKKVLKGARVSDNRGTEPVGDWTVDLTISAPDWDRIKAVLKMKG